ncbi:3-oxo-5-alpha-steroid 4-dehydrogenase 2b isoform X2 [Cyclopterus lumpus]|uniref:3-oxo-5-alpha-steroid 4-dehydrogenase n=1 Tax=Cyclopterus lumpus TaxID=8103 RepID=A0A8C3AIQ6_CYCLU|nr:3-oxo-5-alpha-steroid 4-dehydrogenase 2b isoform X2 [Cyclopterus lumpus]
MHCHGDLVSYLSCGMMLAGLGHLVYHKNIQKSYGRHMGRSPPARTVPARLAWFLQEMPALLVPLLLMLSRPVPAEHEEQGQYLLLGTFCMHYFQRTFVYSLLTRGTPFPLGVMLSAGVFCSLNGLLQGHYLLHCAQFDDEWSADYRYKTGLLLFYIGMAMNVHSDYILRNLRKPGEVVYKIPTGGLFEYVSGANYLGEIVEWFGYAVATWSIPALSFAVFSLCFIGPRAYHHHRFYQETFKDYPKFRKALIPFIF